MERMLARGGRREKAKGKRQKAERLTSHNAILPFAFCLLP
jgi:hypothetical protein